MISYTAFVDYNKFRPKKYREKKYRAGFGPADNFLGVTISPVDARWFGTVADLFAGFGFIIWKNLLSKY